MAATATATDAALTARVAAAAVVSWCVPPRWWGTIGRAVARREVRAQGASHSACLPFDARLARDLAVPVTTIAAERIESGVVSRLLGLREYVWPGRHRPIAVEGMGHVASALNAGHGAILWVGRFTFASIVVKMGLHDAGLQVTHLSRPAHGFGTSAFAVRWLNPVWTRIEERFLLERLVMEPGAETAALRTVRRCLDGNGVVSIAVGPDGARTVAVPFLDGTLTVASGPLHLSSRSPLLPVFAVHERDGRQRVVIEAPLDPAPGVDRDGRERAMARMYAERLEPWVRRYPGQWLG